MQDIFKYKHDDYDDLMTEGEWTFHYSQSWFDKQIDKHKMTKYAWDERDKMWWSVEE